MGPLDEDLLLVSRPGTRITPAQREAGRLALRTGCADRKNEKNPSLMKRTRMTNHPAKRSNFGLHAGRENTPVALPLKGLGMPLRSDRRDGLRQTGPDLLLPDRGQPVRERNTASYQSVSTVQKRVTNVKSAVSAFAGAPSVGSAWAAPTMNQSDVQASLWIHHCGDGRVAPSEASQMHGGLGRFRARPR